MMRKANIAQILARRHIINAYPLRKSSGSIILSSGLPGAIGLLCVGDSHGAQALADVAKRFAEATTHAIASSAVPVKELKYDLSDGWATHYSKLALLAWTSKQSPEDMTSALSKLSTQLNFDDALEQMFGQTLKQNLLGLPNATSFEFEQKNDELTITGERRQWFDGGWKTVDTGISAHQITVDSTGVRLSNKNKLSTLGKEAYKAPVLVIDEWPAYQPSGLSEE